MTFTPVLLILAGFVLAVWGVDWVVLILLRRLLRGEEISDLSASLQDSLTGIGRYIGWAERFFILMMMLVGYYEGIGFILAAKSIFRMGDVTGAKSRRFSEYVILGTLLSFSLAFMIGILLRYVLGLPVEIP